MSTYDPHTTLAAISHNAVAVIGIGGPSIVAVFVFFIEARQRDSRAAPRRTRPIPARMDRLHRLVAEMIRMLVGAARYVPDSSGRTASSM